MGKKVISLSRQSVLKQKEKHRKDNIRMKVKKECDKKWGTKAME